LQVEVPYQSLTHTLQSLKIQVYDSLPHIAKYIPSNIDTPKKLFYYLRLRTKYVNDPKGVEFIQMVPTLMENGGKGDCDCFTVLALTAQYYLNFLPQYVDLAGNLKRAPSHIYTSVWDHTQNKVCVFDLTNPYYDMERPYNYHQRLNFKL
jgi:hypothetical protein